MKAKSTEKDVEQLNSFLRGELSAVETYEQCIEKLSDDPATQAQLRELQGSHQRRVHLLTDMVRKLGGDPARDSGVWGGFAKIAEGSAKIFGTSSAISMLEEGEDHGRNDYNRDIDELSPAVRAFIQVQVMPEQQRTHDALSILQRR